MSANAYVHAPACARCCDGRVFWHRVSEIALHAQRHTTPHKAAHSRLPHMFRIWGGRQAGLLFSMLLPRSFASWTHSWWVTALNLTTVRVKRHRHELADVLFTWANAGRTSNKKTKSPMFLLCHAVSVYSVWYYCKPVINDVIAAFRIHVLVHQCNYSLEMKKLWGIFFYYSALVGLNILKNKMD